MTAFLPITRTLSRQLVTRQITGAARWYTCETVPRVTCTCNGSNQSQRYEDPRLKITRRFRAVRSYATASGAKAAGRPKAHTGRTTSTRTARKPAAKRTTTTKKAVRKPKTKAKAKAKPKPKTRVRKAKKPLSKTAEKRVESAKLKDLRTTALLDEPKALPQTAWTVMFSEAGKKGVALTETNAAVKSAAERFRNLSPSEREHYNHLANVNKEKNQKEYQKWLTTHTPQQVKEANNARRRLTVLEKKKDPKKKIVKKYSPIKDDRLVAPPARAYTLFYKSRFDSGDFAHMAVVEAAKLIARDWKALSAADKKPFNDRADADKTRYITEHKTVYGVEPPNLKK